MVVTARTAFLVWLAAIVLAAAVPVTCAVWMRSPPAPPEPCRDTVELRTVQQSAFACPIGGRLEVWPVAGANDRVLVKCVCGPARAVVDAGGLQ